MSEFDQAHQALENPSIGDIARVAVEFSYQGWTREHEELFPRPPTGVYWTVRLGRLAITRSGTLAWHHRLSSGSDKETVDLAREQRFEDFEEGLCT